MKKMTCRQLGGACDKEFNAETFEEIAEMSKNHGMEMCEKGDEAHLEAMSQIKEVMSQDGAMEKWMDDRRKEFDSLPENWCAG